MLDALARTLRLDTGERAHLFHLARVELPLPAGDYPREAPPELRAVVDALVPNPAYLIGPRTDVLAWNAAAVRVIGEPQTAPGGRLADNEPVSWRARAPGVVSAWSRKEGGAP